MNETNAPDDLKIAISYIQHIRYPCVEPVSGKDIRDFWIKMARQTLPFMRDTLAKSLLEETIAHYRD